MSDTTTDYGTDISTFIDGDLDPDFRPISGPRVIAEAVCRIWNMPRGDMSWSPNMGGDLQSLLNGKFDVSLLSSLESFLEGEALKDGRVEACSVTILLEGGKKLLIKGEITPIVGQTFAFVFNPALLTVELLRSLFQ